MSTSNKIFTASVIVSVLAVIAGGVALGVMFVSILTRPLPVATSEHEIVRAVCDYAYNTDSGESEQACGIAQDVSNTVYTCTRSGCDVKSNVIEVRE